MHMYLKGLYVYLFHLKALWNNKIRMAAWRCLDINHDYCKIHKSISTWCCSSGVDISVQGKPQIMFELIRGDAVKSLAWPGRKQATVTKFGIYSTYSPRSSLHFLAHCSNFRKRLKKIQKFVPPTRSPWQQWPPRRVKNGDLSIVFSVQGTSGSPTGPDPENRVGDQDIGSPGRPVSSGLQVPGEPGHSRARTRPPWWPSRGIFPSKYP